jgi:hypothetical protein
VKGGGRVTSFLSSFFFLPLPLLSLPSFFKSLSSHLRDVVLDLLEHAHERVRLALLDLGHRQLNGEHVPLLVQAHHFPRPVQDFGAPRDLVVADVGAVLGGKGHGHETGDVLALELSLAVPEQLVEHAVGELDHARVADHDHGVGGVVHDRGEAGGVTVAVREHRAAVGLGLCCK